MADIRLITSYPGDATPKDIVLRPLPVADVVTTDIYLRAGDATPKDIVLRNPSEAPTTGAATIVSAGIASGEAFGQPTVTTSVAAQDITGVGQIASAEAFGSPSLGVSVVSAGIVRSEALGTPVVGATVSSSGIASGEAVGQSALSVDIQCTGIASEEAFGLPVVSTATQAAEIVCLGIESSEALGSPVVSVDAVEEERRGGDDAPGWNRKAWARKKKQEDALEETIRVAYLKTLGIEPEVEEVKEIVKEVQNTAVVEPERPVTDYSIMADWLAQQEKIVSQILANRQEEDDEETLLMLL